MSKANEALNKMAENARELGLDYESDGMHHNKPIIKSYPEKDNLAQQEPAPGYCKHCKQYTIEEPLPQQRTWVGLTDEEVDDLSREMVKGEKSVNWLSYSIEAKLKEKNT